LSVSQAVSGGPTRMHHAYTHTHMRAPRSHAPRTTHHAAHITRWSSAGRGQTPKSTHAPLVHQACTPARTMHARTPHHAAHSALCAARILRCSCAGHELRLGRRCIYYLDSPDAGALLGWENSSAAHGHVLPLHSPKDGFEE
jgi:hypothetical protein